MLALQASSAWKEVLWVALTPADTTIARMKPSAAVMSLVAVMANPFKPRIE
jgi:hypothetical protein